jgi:hypothetical protein
MTERVPKSGSPPRLRAFVAVDPRVAKTRVLRPEKLPATRRVRAIPKRTLPPTAR